jgi:hypothetical protein
VSPCTTGQFSAEVAEFVATADVIPHELAQTRLTPILLHVLLAVVEVSWALYVAAAIGVAETTVKTRLGWLYEQTGARRQADLVRLLTGFSTPLFG